MFGFAIYQKNFLMNKNFPDSICRTWLWFFVKCKKSSFLFNIFIFWCCNYWKLDLAEHQAWADMLHNIELYELKK